VLSVRREMLYMWRQSGWSSLRHCKKGQNREVGWTELKVNRLLIYRLQGDEHEGGDEAFSRNADKASLCPRRSTELLIKTGNVMRFEVSLHLIVCCRF
jgi:hypothetical protein